MTTILSIGHSNHPIDRFVALLRDTGVATLADIRSVPASRFCPQFNGKALAASLAAAGIGYVWLGDRLGGMPKDKTMMRGGKPDYIRMAAQSGFIEGIDALVALGRTGSVAMMCAERNPLECHRTHLVTPALTGRGVEVIHLLADGASVPHRSLRLL